MWLAIFALLAAGCGGAVTQADAERLMAELGPRVEAGTGRSLPKGLRVVVWTREQVLEYLDEQRYASTAPEDRPESTHLDDDMASRWMTGTFDRPESLVILCGTNLQQLSELLEVDLRGLLRVTLLHELVHAVDATSYPDRFDNATDYEPDERGVVDKVLLEGHAELMTRRLSATDLERRASEAWTQHFAELRSTTELYLRPAEYLEWLERVNGTEALLIAMQSPPATLDELYYPGRSWGEGVDPGVERLMREFVAEDPRFDTVRLELQPIHEREAALFEAGAAAARRVAEELEQVAALVGHMAAPEPRERVLMRVLRFSTSDAAKAFMDLAQAEVAVRNQRFLDADATSSDERLTSRPLRGVGWTGVEVVHSDLISERARRSTHGESVRENGKISRTHTYAHHGRFVLDFPSLGKNTVHERLPARLDVLCSRLDSLGGAALIPDAR